MNQAPKFAIIRSVDKQDFCQQFDLLAEKAKRIIITTHENPDPDAIGSCLAVHAYLQKKHSQKEAFILINEKPQKKWALFSDFKLIKWTGNLAKDLKKGDLLIFLDGNQLGRFIPDPKKVDLKEFDSICIDHHSDEPDNFTLQLIDPQSVATCQIIAGTLFSEDELLGQREIETLLIGIIADTYCFQLINHELASSFNTVKRLVKLGKIELQSLTFKINQIQLNEFEIIQELVKNTRNIKLKKLPSLTYSFLTKEFKEKYNKETIDAAKEKYIPLFLRKIKDHPWGLVVYPSENQFKISFRSLPKGPNVRDLAAQYFNGGGHPRSAGGKYKPQKEINSLKACQEIIKILDF